MSEEMVLNEYTGEVNVSVPQANVPMYDNINQGTVAVESSRAVAEAQGKLIIAKRFPRDETKALSKILDVCKRKDFAEKAFYSYPRGGQTVSGASIRFAEEIARCWGNIDYGIKELSQNEGSSELQAYCWDMETNTISVQNFTNPHARETKKGITTLTSLRDIYEVNANNGARRLRARILAVIPNYIVEAAIKECEKTLKGTNGEPLIDRVNRMVERFKKFGVTIEMIETRLKRPINTMNADDFVEYTGIYNSIKEKERSVAEWFEYSPAGTKTDLGDMLSE